MIKTQALYIIEIVEIAIAILKNGTVDGKELQIELIKYGTRTLLNLLRSLFHRCLNGEKVPETWKIGLTCLSQKGKKLWVQKL